MTTRRNFTLWEVILSLFVISIAMLSSIALMGSGISNLQSAKNSLQPQAASQLLESHFSSYLQDPANWAKASASPAIDLDYIPAKSTYLTESDKSTVENQILAQSEWVGLIMEQNSGSPVMTNPGGSFEIKAQGQGSYSVTLQTNTSRGSIKRHFGVLCWYEASSDIYTNSALPTNGIINSSDTAAFVRVNYLISWPTNISLDKRISSGNYIYNNTIIRKD